MFYVMHANHHASFVLTSHVIFAITSLTVITCNSNSGTSLDYAKEQNSLNTLILHKTHKTHKTAYRSGLMYVV